MNILQIAGHLARDPETRFTASGQKVTSFTVGVNYRRGGKEEATMWIRVTVWGDRFDKLIQYLKKGSAVIAVGEMHPPAMYTDKEGRQQISLEMTADMIKFSPFGKPDRGGEEGQATAQPQAQSSYQDSGYSNSNSNTNSNANAGYGRGSTSNYGQQPAQSPADDDALPF